MELAQLYEDKDLKLGQYAEPEAGAVMAQLSSCAQHTPCQMARPARADSRLLTVTTVLLTAEQAERLALRGVTRVLAE